VRVISYGGVFDRCDQNGGPDSCWPFTGGRNQKGYGRYCVGGGVILAHRAAYIATHGYIGTDECVLHTCDNPPCCNPAHLWIGSRGDNNADMERKGRANRKAHAVIDERAAEAIRTMRAAGVSGVALAQRFGISQQTVCDVYKGRIWRCE